MARHGRQRGAQAGRRPRRIGSAEHVGQRDERIRLTREVLAVAEQVGPQLQGREMSGVGAQDGVEVNERVVVEAVLAKNAGLLELTIQVDFVALGRRTALFNTGHHATSELGVLELGVRELVLVLFEIHLRRK